MEGADKSENLFVRFYFCEPGKNNVDYRKKIKVEGKKEKKLRWKYNES